MANTLATDNGWTSDAPSTYKQLIPKVCMDRHENSESTISSHSYELLTGQPVSIRVLEVQYYQYPWKEY